jgi:hypothetical protein
MASKPENTPLCVLPCPDCGLPAELLERFSLISTDGSVEHVAVACIAGHYFRMPADRLPADTRLQLRADGVHSDRAAVACLAAGSGAQPSGPALPPARLPGRDRVTSSGGGRRCHEASGGSDGGERCRRNATAARAPRRRSVPREMCKALPEDPAAGGQAVGPRWPERGQPLRHAANRRRLSAAQRSQPPAARRGPPSRGRRS